MDLSPFHFRKSEIYHLTLVWRWAEKSDFFYFTGLPHIKLYHSSLHTIEHIVSAS